MPASAIHFRSSDYLAKYYVLDEDEVNELNKKMGSDLSVDDFTIDY